MAGTHTKLIYHIIFSTKDRQPLIAPRLREKLYPYIGGIVRAQDGVLPAIGGMPNHIHLVVRIVCRMMDLGLTPPGYALPPLRGWFGVGLGRMLDLGANAARLPTVAARRLVRRRIIAA
jgi:hypothetical protein